ncbi:MAG TPA: replication initiator [Mycobacteriales bacterium]
MSTSTGGKDFAGAGSRADSRFRTTPRRHGTNLAPVWRADRRPGHRRRRGLELTPERVAAYLAKYATKAAEDFGLGERRLSGLTLDGIGVSAHVARIVRTAWHLGALDELAGLRRWLHMLGYRGHFATKSRRYSTTLGALRRERSDYRRRRAGEGMNTQMGTGAGAPAEPAAAMLLFLLVLALPVGGPPGDRTRNPRIKSPEWFMSARVNYSRRVSF